MDRTKTKPSAASLAKIKATLNSKLAAAKSIPEAISALNENLEARGGGPTLASLFAKKGKFSFIRKDKDRYLHLEGKLCTVAVTGLIAHHDCAGGIKKWGEPIKLKSRDKFTLADVPEKDVEAIRSIRAIVEKDGFTALAKRNIILPVDKKNDTVMVLSYVEHRRPEYIDPIRWDPITATDDDPVETIPWDEVNFKSKIGTVICSIIAYEFGGDSDPKIGVEFVVRETHAYDFKIPGVLPVTLEHAADAYRNEVRNERTSPQKRLFSSLMD